MHFRYILSEINIRKYQVFQEMRVNPIGSEVCFERLKTRGVLFATPFYDKNQRVSELAKSKFYSVKVACLLLKPEICDLFPGSTVLEIFFLNF